MRPFQRFNESAFTGTTVLLGVGTLLVWCGVLRYLGFFAHYNVLMQVCGRGGYMEDTCRFMRLRSPPLRATLLRKYQSRGNVDIGINKSDYCPFARLDMDMDRVRFPMTMMKRSDVADDEAERAQRPAVHLLRGPALRRLPPLRLDRPGALLHQGWILQTHEHLCGSNLTGSFQFKDVLSASECLFSLINGDDMFATFFTISDHNQVGGSVESIIG
jgi:hypothetical protein